MDEQRPIDRLRENATEVASILVTGIWLGALLTGQSWWLGALIFGYAAVVPLVQLLFGDEEDQDEGSDGWWSDQWNWWGNETEANSTDSTETTSEGGGNRDALETLRDRYARGELTDEQFERKLERLLETETIEDAEDRLTERT